MVKWVDAAGTPLIWQQTAKRLYQLHRGRDCEARLTWLSDHGSLARADCPEGSWTFKRMGFFNPYLTVRAQGAESDSALMYVSLGETQLRFADGRAYFWRRVPPREGEVGFVDASNRAAMIFTPSGRGDALSAWVRPGPGPTPPDTAALLALLGWYRLVLEQRDLGAPVRAQSVHQGEAAAL